MRGKDIFGRRMAAMMAAVLLFTSVDIPTVATEGEELTYSSDAAGDSASASPAEDAEQEIVLDEDISGDGEPVQSDDRSSQAVESADGITIDAISVVEPETEDAENAEKAFDAMSVTAADLKGGRDYLFYTVIDRKVYLLAHHEGEVITVRADASVLGSDTAAGSRFEIPSTLDCEKYDPQSGTYERISLESGGGGDPLGHPGKRWWLSGRGSFRKDIIYRRRYAGTFRRCHGDGSDRYRSSEDTDHRCFRCQRAEA